MRDLSVDELKVVSGAGGCGYYKKEDKDHKVKVDKDYDKDYKEDYDRKEKEDCD